MRLLPRSARGTWLLAVAAWVVGCAGLWFVLPPQPRTAIRIESNNWILGVGPGGRTVTLVGQGQGNEGDRVPVRIWDTTDGSLRTVIPDKDVMSTCAQSPNGRWLVVGIGAADHDGGVRALRISNLSTGTADEWVCPPGPAKRFEFAEFSPDSRWLLFSERLEKGGEGDRGIRLWDLEGRRPGLYIPDARFPVFSPNGNFIAMRRSDDDKDAVIETATGRELYRIFIPHQAGVAGLTPDGTGLILWTELMVGPRTGGTADATGYTCRNVSDGRERWSLKELDHRLFPICSGRRLAVSFGGSGTRKAGEIMILESDDGRVVARFHLSESESLCNAGPTGKTLAVISVRPSLRALIQEWLADHAPSWFDPVSSGRLELRESATGRAVLALPDSDGPGPVYAPDESAVAVMDSGGRLALWDIPPRRPLTWLALAAVLALLLAGLAWRRSRRLRREVA